MSKKSVFKHQYKAALQNQVRFGQSKHKDKIEAKEKCRRENKPYEAPKGIYSTRTLNNYDSVCEQFTSWVLENHRHEVKSYADCQKFAADWLKAKEEKGLSAWSLHLYGAALAASFGGISKNDLGYTFPARERKNIIRNRNDNLTGEYATKRQRDAYIMLKATGCRRAESLRLRKEDFREQLGKDNNPTGLLEVFKRGKGGVERWCLVNPLYTDFVRDFLAKVKTYSHAGEERLFEKNDVPKGGIHSARAVYACDLYHYYEEHGYASGKIYHCRKELYGATYDKGILKEVSYNLQHARNSIVINYLWLMRE
ncbi:MAG: hypothetical protein J1E03_04385 [Acetatifactor sp.]|nr:hypothetical protein [Acetatifactor sp.]